MKHWFLKDESGRNIGHLSLEEDVDLPKLITNGHDFKLDAEYLPGSDSPRWFVVTPVQ